MNSVRFLIIVIYLLISLSGKTQSDTNHLYLDYIQLQFEDSTEKLLSLVFENNSNTIVFTDTSQCKMFGINRYKTCNLSIRTNKSTVILENINEYISFINTKYRISVFMPLNHNDYVSALYMEPSGYILLHSQTGELMDQGVIFGNCVEVDAAPVGYTRFEEFKVKSILE